MKGENKMKKTIVAYKLREPKVYNKGTKYETKEDTFLAWYTEKNKEVVEKEIKKLNEEKPERQPNGKKINWDEIEYYFVDEQEEMIG